MPFPLNLILTLNNGSIKIRLIKKLLILILINGMMNGALKEIVKINQLNNLLRNLI
jgi:hypothetical protein